MPISESFCKRGQFAYLKSCSLKVRLLIQHICRGSTAILSGPGNTVMHSPWSLTGQLKVASVFLDQVIDTSIRSSWFCSCHPGDAFLDHLANRTCIHRYKETLLNQLFPHSSVPKKQTEMPIYQSFLFFNIYSFIYFLAESGLSCGMRDLSLWRTGSSLQCVSFSLVVARGLWSAWALQSWHVGSLVLVRRLSCPAACGILVL